MYIIIFKTIQNKNNNKKNKKYYDDGNDDDDDDVTKISVVQSSYLTSFVGEKTVQNYKKICES